MAVSDEGADVTQELVDRLDRVIVILQLAHADAIERTQERIRSDKVNAAILDGAKNWTPAGNSRLRSRRRRAKGGTTFNERVAELLAKGVLEKQGGGPTTQYKATGLV